MALNTGRKLLFITLLKLLQHTSAIDIQNVTSTGMIASPYAHSGVVTVKFQDIWGYVCYYGSKKRWGKREATTVCKQLGYMGGWPTMRDEIERSTHNLYNVDCDDGLNDLNNCDFDMISDCERSTIAGIQCYNSFQIKLADGDTPNIGRLQVEYDDVLSEVCYLREDSITWEFYNTQVLCRELGYPGTMFDREASVNYEMEGSTISGYECRDDLKEASLKDCYPDLPYQHPHTGSEACKGIIAACAGPGYVGCFERRENELQISFKSVNMTINQCRHYCRNKVYRYAFLSRGDTCSCSADITRNSATDRFCNIECSGDGDQVCGDDSTSSVYDVTLGTCDDPLDGNLVYFFGEEFTKDCKSASQKTDQIKIQCVLSNETGEVAWTAFEECPDKGGNDEDAKNSGTGLKKTPLITLIVLVFIVIIVGAVCSLYRSRKVRNERDKAKDIEMNSAKGDQEGSLKFPETSDGLQGESMNQDDSSSKKNKIDDLSLYEHYLQFLGRAPFSQSNSPEHTQTPKHVEDITPVDHYFGKPTANYEHIKKLADQDNTYKNRKFFRRAKKHKSGYTEVPNLDPIIYSENITGQETCHTSKGRSKKVDDGNEEDDKYGQKGKSSKITTQIKNEKYATLLSFS